MRGAFHSAGRDWSLSDRSITGPHSTHTSNKEAEHEPDPLGHADGGEGNTRFLTSRETPDWLLGKEGSNVERSELAAVALFTLARKLLHKEFQAGDVEVQLVDVMLGEVAHPEGAVGVAKAPRRLQISQE